MGQGIFTTDKVKKNWKQIPRFCKIGIISKNCRVNCLTTNFKISRIRFRYAFIKYVKTNERSRCERATEGYKESREVENHPDQKGDQKRIRIQKFIVSK